MKTDVEQNRGAVIAPGILLGAGMGGFFDGILLHQNLQWHNMLSSYIPPVTLVATKINMVWDGLFHAATWLVTALGIALLWHAGTRRDVSFRTSTFVGSLALGWGLFNVVEGVIDHHILGLHHVHPGAGQLAWDLGFLGLGAVLIGLGVALLRSPRRGKAPTRTKEPAIGPGRPTPQRAPT